MMVVMQLLRFLWLRLLQGQLVNDMRYLASVVTQCFTSFGELLALNKRFAELSGGVTRYTCTPCPVVSLQLRVVHLHGIWKVGSSKRLFFLKYGFRRCSAYGLRVAKMRSFFAHLRGSFDTCVATCEKGVGDAGGGGEGRPAAR